MCVKVFLGSNGEVEEYSVTSIQENAAISSDLILDQKEEHLFIMTHNKVWLPTNVLLGQLFWKDSDLPFLLSVLILTFFLSCLQLQKRPVAECQQHLDCHSCLLAHDPYCGWCILEGR